MNFSRILCPTDFSDFSGQAIALAAQLAKETGAELILLHSADGPIAYREDSENGGVDSARAELQAKLDAVALPTADLRVRRLLVEGDPATAIVDVARNEKVDLLVISTHGRTGLTRMLMGSVAEFVVRHAPCAALTVKNPQRMQAS